MSKNSARVTNSTSQGSGQGSGRSNPLQRDTMADRPPCRHPRHPVRGPIHIFLLFKWLRPLLERLEGRLQSVIIAQDRIPGKLAAARGRKRAWNVSMSRPERPRPQECAETGVTLSEVRRPRLKRIV